MLGRCSVPSSLFFCQIGDSGKNGTDEEERNRGKNSPQDRVAPGFVAAMDRGQQRADREAQITRAAHQDSARGGEYLREAKNRFSLFSFRKKFGEPGGRGDEFD